MEREAKLGIALPAALALLIFAGVMGVGCKTLRTGPPEPEPARSEQPHKALRTEPTQTEQAQTEPTQPEGVEPVPSEQPTPEEVVEGLRAEGLVEYEPIPWEEWDKRYGTEMPEWAPAKDSLHFYYVGQLDESYGGDVFVFESQEDLEEVMYSVRDGNGYPYNYYQEGLVLLRVDAGEYALSDSQAACFGRVLKEIVQEKTGNRGAEESIPSNPCGL